MLIHGRANHERGLQSVQGSGKKVVQKIRIGYYHSVFQTYYL